VSPRLAPFKKGAFHLAIQAGVPVVPIVIHNSGDVAPKGDFVFRPATVEVDVLPPVDTSGWTADTVEAHVAEVRGLFQQTLGQEQERAALPAIAEPEAVEPIVPPAAKRTRPPVAKKARRKKAPAKKETKPVATAPAAPAQVSGPAVLKKKALKKKARRKKKAPVKAAPKKAAPRKPPRKKPLRKKVLTRKAPVGDRGA